MAYTLLQLSLKSPEIVMQNGVGGVMRYQLYAQMALYSPTKSYVQYFKPGINSGAHM